MHGGAGARCDAFERDPRAVGGKRGTLDVGGDRIEGPGGDRSLHEVGGADRRRPDSRVEGVVIDERDAPVVAVHRCARPAVDRQRPVFESAEVLSRRRVDAGVGREADGRVGVPCHERRGGDEGAIG